MSGYISYQDKLDSGLERVVLSGPGCMAQIAPGAGLNLYSWIVGGRELLMPTQDIGAGGAGYGNPILFPTPNRTRESTYTFQGETHTLVKNGKPRFIHGLAQDESFTFRHWSDEKGAYVEGSMEIREGMEVFEGYPYPCKFVVTISFCEKGISIDFSVVSLGKRDMPYGIAIHPYFTKAGNPDRVFLSCPAQMRFEADDKLLPTGKLIPVAGDARYDLAKLRPLSNADVDTVYSGMDSQKSSRIEFRDWGLAVTLNADDAFGKAVVYTPKNRPGFCIEPQTCSTDFINLFSKGYTQESGMLILGAGDTWKGQIRLSVQAL